MTNGIETALTKVRQSGGRVTNAKRAVLEELHRGEHLTADDLADRVHSKHPGVHVSTVYRTLDQFEALGIVTHVHLGHGRATFHLADDRHHHAVCEHCHAVIELPADLLDAIEIRLRDTLGFVAHTQHFAIEGRCAACAAAS
jgi:Fur family ferric uptake transcriptional regulator